MRGIKKNKFPICDLFDILVRDVNSFNVCVPVLLVDLQTSVMREEGRKDWEVGLCFGIRIKQMIILILIEFSFFFIILYFLENACQILIFIFRK